MQSFTVLVLVAIVAAVTAQEYYTGKWNTVNTHPIIDNERLYNKYEDCILGTKTSGCTQDALDLKHVLPEALEQVCAKCSPVQQDKVKDTLSYICQKRPQSFAKILAKIDPEGKFRPVFEAKFGTISGGC